MLPGNLSLTKSLNDGFTSATVFTLPATAGRTWSYRLIAGADLLASDVMQLGASTAGSGTIKISGGVISGGQAARPVMVRTGDGRIDVAASGDLILDNRAALIYTAGLNSNEGIPLDQLSVGVRPYPERGGDIQVTTLGNIQGAPTNQIVSEWLWRTGQKPNARGVPSAGFPVGWSVELPALRAGHRRACGWRRHRASGRQHQRPLGLVGQHRAAGRRHDRCRQRRGSDRRRTRRRSKRRRHHGWLLLRGQGIALAHRRRSHRRR